jgi:hypothetical protein
MIMSQLTQNSLLNGHNFQRFDFGFRQAKIAAVVSEHSRSCPPRPNLFSHSGHGISVKKISCLHGNNVLPRNKGVYAFIRAYDNTGRIRRSKSVINARNKIFLAVARTDFEGQKWSGV